MLINKCADSCPGKYLLPSNISKLENTNALTRAFLSYIVIVILLLKFLRAGLVGFVLGLIYCNAF